MRYLRIQSKFELEDEKTIHRHTFDDFSREVKWAKPIILYLEDHRRYQADFMKGLEHACKIADVPLPTTIILRSINEFKAVSGRIVDKTKNSSAHICVIDGVLEDGYCWDAMPEVTKLEAKLERETPGREHIFLCYILTGDIDLARRAFTEVKAGKWKQVDGVFTKPLETYTDGLFQMFNRDGVHGIGSHEQLYQKITGIMKRTEDMK